MGLETHTWSISSHLLQCFKDESITIKHLAMKYSMLNFKRFADIVLFVGWL